MPITLTEAQSALTTALNMWLDQNPQGFQVNVNGQAVNIIYSRNGNRLDFGFPNLYPLRNSDVAALTAWWTAQHSGTKMLPPQMEPGSGLYKINAVLLPVSPQGVMLNFHIPLTD
ncbi:MAG: hypothetical protein ACK40L_08080 [Hydrogenophaga sp.]|jgi:hypothetical protein|nr:hypothetical protein [Hydrogenophaga sp.]